MTVRTQLFHRGCVGEGKGYLEPGPDISGATGPLQQLIQASSCNQLKQLSRRARPSWTRRCRRPRTDTRGAQTRTSPSTPRRQRCCRTGPRCASCGWMGWSGGFAATARAATGGRKCTSVASPAAGVRVGRVADEHVGRVSSLHQHELWRKARLSPHGNRDSSQ